ncbi:hypothetical protein BDZ45DRAFT_601373, partial [Acephala macrosclerotiorum]
IHLLKLLPTDSKPISYKIIHTSLDDALSYDVLSYVWGESTRAKTIMVDDHKLGVTSNLLAALVRLRSGIMTAYIWIDAISINQDDYVERNHEVLKMGQIYNSASRVIIWLGPGGNDNEEAFETVNSIATLRGQLDLAVGRFIQEPAGRLQQGLVALYHLTLMP